MKTPVFVYGTLKKGHPLHRFINRSPIHTRAILRKARLYHLGAFPGLKLATKDQDEFDSEETVEGEVYLCDSQQIQYLDAVEGVPSLYQRIEVDVEVEDGKTLRGVFTYLFARSVEGYESIPGGVWER